MAAGGQGGGSGGNGGATATGGSAAGGTGGEAIDAADDEGTPGTGGEMGDSGTAADTGTVTASGPVLLVTGTDPQPAPDNGMKAELTAMGLKFDFQNSDMMPLTMQSANGHSLIIISPNTPRKNVPAAFKDLPIPILVSKDGPYEQLMMAACECTTAPDMKTINIVAPMDPLAAGFPMGSVSVMGAANRMVNGMPSPEAKVVATVTGTTRPAIFYYTTGQMMLGGTKAPAKRIGFFWHRTEDATADGKKLFRAAVEWALKP
jgi:hypothetical protein